MIRIACILIFLTCACINIQAQVNLVKNPSFEEHTQCPDDWDQVKRCKYWSGIDSTQDYDPFNTNACLAEYCNVCAPPPPPYQARLPQEVYFYQYPKTGNGLMEVQVYYDYLPEPYKRDYIIGRLSSSLTHGKSYCVSFYVNLAEFSEYAINKIGAYLDNGAICNATNYCDAMTQFSPQVYAPNIINDTQNWVRVQGSFIAQGGERFITIGNFVSNANTSVINLNNTGNHGSWYLIDDVSVIESDLPADAGTDRLIGLGDSTFIGRTPEIGLECKWFVGSTQVGTGAGIWVKPTQTTPYILEQTLCGLVKKDTVIVYVVPAGVESWQYAGAVCSYSIVPNPNKGDFTLLQSVAHDEEQTAMIYDAMGRLIESREIFFRGGKAVMQIKNISSGLYRLRLKGKNGMMQTLKMLIE